LNLLEYLYQALNEPHGVELFTTDRDRLRQQLYQTRKQACDPELDTLSFVYSPTDDNHLWILKR
jgi:DNA-binding phage protein